MKRIILFIAAFSVTITSFSQQKKELKRNESTNLIEATYYYDNGQISQKGTFDLAGKLHGKWISYNEAGEKTSVGKYNRGVRTGKWSFWSNGNLKEVEFDDNTIASVTTKEQKSSLAVKD